MLRDLVLPIGALAAAYGTAVVDTTTDLGSLPDYLSKGAVVAALVYVVRRFTSGDLIVRPTAEAEKARTEAFDQLAALTARVADIAEASAAREQRMLDILTAVTQKIEQ